MIKKMTPTLVWPGDEVDVLVDFIWEEVDKKKIDAAETILNSAGISFGHGYGCGKITWFWPELEGPIRVTFYKRNKTRPAIKPRYTLVDIWR